MLHNPVERLRAWGVLRVRVGQGGGAMQKPPGQHDLGSLGSAWVVICLIMAMGAAFGLAVFSACFLTQIRANN